jgi:hypothetical protein
MLEETASVFADRWRSRSKTPWTQGECLSLASLRKASRHREPSKASLRETPEIDLRPAKVHRKPYGARDAAEDGTGIGRYRPRKGEETGPTTPRSTHHAALRAAKSRAS